MNKETKSLLKAMEYLSDFSDNVLLPLKKIYEYDFVFEEEERFYKVKVIYSEHEISKNNYEINLRSSGGYNKSNTLKKSFNNKICDWLFLRTPKDCYLIPTSEVTNKRSLNTKNLNKYKTRGNSSVG